jgi:hypothetical protein
MTWHTLEHSIFSQEPGEESLQTFCLDTYLSELAKSSPIQETCSSPANETESCQSSPYGTTYAPLTESLGEDQLTFFAEASHVRTSVRQVKEQELQGSVRDFGRNMRDSLVLAYAMHQRLQGDQCARGLDSQGRQESDGSTSECGSLWWHTDPAESPTEPIVGRVAHGVAHRVDRLKAIGNGQVSQCATMAFSILSEGLI